MTAAPEGRWKQRGRENVGGKKWDEGYREAWREGRGRERASDVRTSSPGGL